MEKTILKASPRTDTGKEASVRLRNQGMIPAVVYKKAHETISVCVYSKDMFHVLHTSAGENAIITLQLEGQEGKPAQEKTVIVKETQYHPIKGDILHVDFHEILLTEKITVSIPIETKGEPVGVKADGGTLDHPLKELNIECLPTNIPEKISVHVDSLKIGDSIKVKELDIPDGITILDDLEQTVILVVPPKTEEEAAEGEAGEALGEQENEPEVIKQKKPEDAPEAKE
jgi:large subunit ribosomal protein L25